MVVSLDVLTDIGTFLCVVLSYIYIIKTITKFPSAQQKMKAFSTCSSHMTVVFITYGSCIFIYVKPSAKDEVTINKCVSALTTSVAPIKPIHLYTEEQASETSFYRLNQKNFIDLKEVKKCWNQA